METSSIYIFLACDVSIMFTKIIRTFITVFSRDVEEWNFYVVHLVKPQRQTHLTLF